MSEKTKSKINRFSKDFAESKRTFYNNDHAEKEMEFTIRVGCV